ncbi:MAG: hypothetical protein GWO04_48805 [Actinobacteria bacterium]|nr:hypothetical protein [Actinomycetota bacterium]
MSRSTVSRDWKSVPPVVAGVGLLVAAAALAPHTRMVVTEASRGQALWLVLNSLLLGLGAALLLGRRRPWGARLSLVVLSVGIGGGLLGELMFRVGIGLDIRTRSSAG